MKTRGISPIYMKKQTSVRTAKQILLLAVILLLISLPVLAVMAVDSKADIYGHVLLVVKGATTGSWPSYFLYHWTVYLLSLRSTDETRLMLSSVGVLSVFVFLKGLLSFRIIVKSIGRYRLATLVTIGLVLSAPILNWWEFPKVYLGQIATNVWHNPTTIFAMPFAIVLFCSSVKAIKTMKTRDLLIVSIMIVLNALSKPNYLLAFIPAFGLVILIRGYHLIKKQNYSIPLVFWLLAILFTPVVIVLGIQYIFTFGQGNSAGAGIVFGPFKLWRIYSPHIPLSLLLSLAFPLSYTIAYAEKVFEDEHTVFAWAVFITSLLQFSLFYEFGQRFWHGNLGWGSIISLYILFLYCAAGFFKQRVSKRFYVVFTLFILHIASGIFYYLKIVYGLGYW